jgi:hypothetical protein
MRSTAWILGVSLAVLLAALVGCGGSSTSGKTSSSSEKKTEDKPTPPKSDPG